MKTNLCCLPEWPPGVILTVAGVLINTKPFPGKQQLGVYVWNRTRATGLVLMSRGCRVHCRLQCQAPTWITNNRACVEGREDATPGWEWSPCTCSALLASLPECLHLHLVRRVGVFFLGVCEITSKPTPGPCGVPDCFMVGRRVHFLRSTGVKVAP